MIAEGRSCRHARERGFSPPSCVIISERPHTRSLTVTEAQWMTIYRETVNPLYGYLARRTGGIRELNEDIVQETYLRALESWGRKGTPDIPLAWLQRVALNLLIDHLRRSKGSHRGPARPGGRPGHLAARPPSQPPGHLPGGVRPGRAQSQGFGAVLFRREERPAGRFRDGHLGAGRGGTFEAGPPVPESAASRNSCHRRKP